MRDWIRGIQKAAIEHRAGVAEQEWSAAEREAGYEAPEELRDLYQHLNGATFATGVVLYPLRGSGEVRGMFEQNQAGGAGLPTSEVWRFGRHDTEHLVAMRKRALAQLLEDTHTTGADWLAGAPEDTWAFVARDEAQDGLRVYRTLELMLTSRIPPAATEDFGDTTFARALSLVELALDEVEPTKRPAPPIPAGVKRAAAAPGPRAPAPAGKKGVTSKVRAAVRAAKAKLTSRIKGVAKSKPPAKRKATSKSKTPSKAKVSAKAKAKASTKAKPKLRVKPASGSRVKKKKNVRSTPKKGGGRGKRR